MVLMEELYLSNGVLCKFYNGIDFNLYKAHNDSSVFIVFLVENFEGEIIKWKRAERLKKLDDTNYEILKLDPYNINNHLISVFQTKGFLNEIKETIKDKLLNGSYPFIFNNTFNIKK